MRDDLIKVKNFLTQIDTRRSTIEVIDSTLASKEETFLVGARYAMCDGRGVGLSLDEATAILGSKRGGLKKELGGLEEKLAKILEVIEPEKNFLVLTDSVIVLESEDAVK